MKILSSSSMRIIRMFVAIVLIALFVIYQIHNVPYSYIVDGKCAVVGFTGFFILFFLYVYVSFEFFIMCLGWYSWWAFVIFVVVHPMIVVLGVYTPYFNEYSRKVEHEIMEDSYIKIGYIYKVRDPLGKGVYHKELRVGIDKDHLFVHKISNNDCFRNHLDAGDTILLRVSDKYPRVSKVLKLDPTHEEIERYKVPRKFKSYINGKIEEEEE